MQEKVYVISMNIQLKFFNAYNIEIKFVNEKVQN